MFGGLALFGILLDKWGVRVAGTLYVGMMVAGAGLVTWAILGGGKQSSTLAYAGCMVFGLGSEMAGTVVNRSIGRWFKDGAMAFAMGLHLAIARLGTAFALVISPSWSRSSRPCLFPRRDRPPRPRGHGPDGGRPHPLGHFRGPGCPAFPQVGRHGQQRG